MDSSTLRSPIESLSPSKPIFTEVTATVSEAIEIMKKNKFGCVCVVENDQLVGIITERDILTKVVGSNIDPKSLSVREVMTTNPEYLFHDDEMAFALNRMHVGGFRHIPLIDLDGHPTGVISVRDIVDHLYGSIGDGNSN